MAQGKLRYSTKPLSGRQVAITRARSQAGSFARRIEDLGGGVIEFPTIEILAPESYDPLDKAIEAIATYHWIIFTSINGVKHFWLRFQHRKRPVRDLKGIRIAAIGPETARALEAIDLRADLVPREYQAEAILEALKPDELRGKKILLPRAAQARDILPETLRGWGAEVDVVEAYRTIAGRADAASLKTLLRAKKVDVITFTSSSTVHHFVRLFAGADMKELLARTAVACIGPITQKTAEEKGIRVDIVPREYTIPGLTQAIVEYFSK